ncbi:uncharacterized protein TRIADDRAFT_26979 [Trichoplax adhaerens]|uniref:UBC core domain-containing protein n=1 Tax=Trichoplax adhaerens TaxID=10228 RepID=B3S0V0_TRIAD|nr:hypothetical protein TRIADDRAFT_26979 [Trichoplax adhaerens]EDV23709.1 hypothetical protein TRIADDRAFT_26979 [Trichoplax adhaerens]|eukprot:XP_002113235.1 hypothetical protein TRIADDRAFT_26979 [Trichoplax adhaerens]
MAAMPPHSLLSFGMFLNLNGFAEKLLSNETSARWLFRLTSGVEISTEGGNISTVAGKLSLPLKPFTALESLFHEIQFSCSEGIDLRTEAIELGIMHLLITCLKIFGHLEPFISIDQNSVGKPIASAIYLEKSRDHDLYYMAKGTGFGTGSIASNWDVDQLLIVQQIEESHINAILNVITSFLEYDKSTYLSLDTRVKDTISTILKKLALLFKESNFVVFINNCLRNDSVLDIAHHIPMYQSLLNVVRNIAKWPTLIPLLAPDVTSSEGSDGVVDFIKNLKSCIEIYLGRLRPSKKGTFKNGDKMIDEEDQDRKNIASLIPNILTTLEIVENGIASYRNVNEDMPTLVNTNADINEEQHDGDSDQNYVAKMRSLQFDTYCITTETDENETIFNVRYHYASAVRSAIANGSDSGSSERARRLAQEAAALSNSLPLSASSSVFVRCDEERLDIMKVIVTGPSGTPYANGCFEFDTYFPPEYPNVPMQITLITTGNHTVRFNPNLYNEGKVCLSILNTWVGRPEEKWSPQTSNFLQVLVSIQSLILVSEPYFNEPGYERSYNTPHGQQASLEYSANIRQATVRWAMLEQLRNPPSGFEDVIQSHFAMKRSEILKQCQNWREEYEDIVKNHSKKASKAFVNSLELLKKHINKLQEELKKL